jgi:hypothetical protein
MAPIAQDKPMKLMTDGYAKFGEVFTVPVAHKSITFLIGPDVAPHYFKATDDEMSNTEVRGMHGRPVTRLCSAR